MTTWKKWSAWVSFTCAPYFLYSCKTRPMYILPSIPPVFDLIDGINVEAIEQKIKRYSKENAEQIMINRARKVGPTLALLFLILVR
jgi:arginine/lysine/ornithine decarboxylase